MIKKQHLKIFYGMLILFSILLAHTNTIKTGNQFKSKTLSALRTKLTRTLTEEINDAIRPDCWFGRLLNVLQDKTKFPEDLFNKLTMRDIIIPGTHDTNAIPDSKEILDKKDKLDVDTPQNTLSKRTILRPFVNQMNFYTQFLTLEQQMNIGVRFFDNRYRTPSKKYLNGDNLIAYHGDLFKYEAKDIYDTTNFQDAERFLNNCPDDFLIFKIKIKEEKDVNKFLIHLYKMLKNNQSFR